MPSRVCIFLFLILIASAPAAEAPAPAAATAAVPRKLRLLMISQSCGYRHPVVARPPGRPGDLSEAERRLTEIGARSSAFTAECSQDASILNAERLKNVDALLFFTSGDLPVTPANFAAVQEWTRKGGAIIGIHSATDTFKEFKPYYDLMGATFLRHPWNKGAAIVNLDPTHPAVKMFPANFRWNDEICEYHYFEPRKVRVLLSVDMPASQPSLIHSVPVCWVREYGKGRVFYTNFGNSEAVWRTEEFRQHLLAGIRWAGKLEDGSAEPNPDAMAREDEKARMFALEQDRPWLAKASRSAGADFRTVEAAIIKMAHNDKAGFAKLIETIGVAREDERSRAAHLRRGESPSAADVETVQRRRAQIVEAIPLSP